MSNLEATDVNPRGNNLSSLNRNDSMDVLDHRFNHDGNLKPDYLAPYPRGYAYPPQHYSSSRPPHPIHSVVTTSFSTDEEREDGSSRRFGHPSGPHFPHTSECRSPGDGYHHEFRGSRRHMLPTSHSRDDNRRAFEPPHSTRDEIQYGRELPPVQEDDSERHPAPQDMNRSRTMRVPPSPRGQLGELPPPLHRTHSTGSSQMSYRGSGPMKRSFWHHARSGEEYQGSLPHEFMPPKRSKVSSSSSSSPRREYVVTARSHSSDDVFPSERHGGGQSHHRPPSGWFNRAMSWDGREEYYHREPRSPWSRSPPYREGGGSQRWSEAPMMPSPRGRYAQHDGGHYDMPPVQPWGPPRWHYQDEAPWGGPQHRDEAESTPYGQDYQEREGFDIRRQNTFERSPGSEAPMRFISAPSMKTTHGETRLGSKHSLDKEGMDIDKKAGPIRLLALPDDRISLSETLCLVRENIEVFTATIEDVEAPAPGRKHAVVVGQVGLRCIHCRHTTRSSERVKRAVCYPSSIKRIYRTVIDMKLDHFLHCKFVPDTLKDTLEALKANNTRSTGTTMQYFIRAAATLGMVDGPSGVRLAENAPENFNVNHSLGSKKQSNEKSPSEATGGKASNGSLSSRKGNAGRDFGIHRKNSISSESSVSAMADDASVPSEVFTGKIPLSLPEDKMSLSPLRCFLRAQVCAFSATEEDIAVRTPTTFSVSVGQVGIGCVHCLNQPAKMRLNRAVCFPFSIARIYQSVADIQRFHLGECKLVPPDVKEKFVELQNASSKGSKGLATRQYWVTSAKKIGLVDTSKGIRFGRDPSQPEQKAVSLDILAQVASNVTTVNKPLVLPEDKPFIAEFLYVVMDQLQPCRFTEADRNKRRLKDVGCIGVECKHCAGQVESRKFFWSSVNAVESNFVSVHTHMMECKMIPDPLKDKLAELKKLRKEQTSALKTGSQKAFFSRVWKRLHSDGRAKAQKQEKESQKEESQNTTQKEDKKEQQREEDPSKEEKEEKEQEKESIRKEGKSDTDKTPEKKNTSNSIPASPRPSKSSDEMETEKVMEEPVPESPSSKNLKAVSDKMAIVSV